MKRMLAVLALVVMVLAGCSQGTDAKSSFCADLTRLYDLTQQASAGTISPQDTANQLNTLTASFTADFTAFNQESDAIGSKAAGDFSRVASEFQAAISSGDVAGAQTASTDLQTAAGDLPAGYCG